MNKSDTPRTNEANRKWQMPLHDFEFSQQLERELNEAKADLENLRRERDQWHACFQDEHDRFVAPRGAVLGDSDPAGLDPVERAAKHREIFEHACWS